MTIPEVQILAMKRELSSASALEAETATQSPRSTANSFNASSVETPWSGCKSGTSRDSRVAADDDSESCSDDEAASAGQGEHDDYYGFLRELAGSFDKDDGSEEEDLESEPGCLAGDRHEKHEEATREVTPHLRKRSSAFSSDSDKVDSVVTSKPPASSHGPRVGRHRETSSISKTSSFDDSDTSDSEHDMLDDAKHLQDTPRDESSGTGKSSGEYPSPEDDDYDVVKAVQQYASQRPGNRMQHWCEDMQAAIRLRRMQAYPLGLAAKKADADPKVRAHYARMRIELLMQAKALESRFLQVVRPAGDARVPGARLEQESLVVAAPAAERTPIFVGGNCV